MLTLTCKRAAVFLSVSLERALPLRERLRLRLHLRVCAACARLKTQLRLLRRVLRRRADPLVDQTVAAALTPAARARIARALRDRDA